MATDVMLFKSPTMKHTSSSRECYEFNLGKAPELRCIHAQKNTICGECEACSLTSKVNGVKEWFFRMGDQTKKRFMLGLIRRLHSVDLLQHLVSVLGPLMCKDFIYARSRTHPSLGTDRCTMSSDRALNAFETDRTIAETWYWFQTANYWTKWNFILFLLQDCEAHLLNLIGTQARTQLSSEQKSFISDEDNDYETSSIASSHYTFESDDHPELRLLTTAHSGYSDMRQDPFTPAASLFDAQTPATIDTWQREIINDDSGDEGFADEGSIDPACMVIATSTKAHSGVTKYKDFIRCLPVHIAKMILGLLDKVSLFNCVCVSKYWRPLVEQVHKEYYVNQNLWEEVMLMQGAAAQGCNPVYAKDIDVAVPNLEADSFMAIRTGEDMIQTTFKSEVSYETAYSGYSTRNIIMEERNVYCGAYNVMVLMDEQDPARVIHTNGGKLICLGLQDRRLHFIDSDTGHVLPLIISGHAGSIRCVALNEQSGYVLSGSYDTSIRCWSLQTGKCQRIFRGHRDTVMCLQIWNDMLVSGGKDNMCKVWNMSTGKCMRTFKHRAPILAVALSEDMCISGCEKGKVKVWDMKSGKLIKKLSGHHGPVSDVKFDRWHIVTASKDGYALAWSSQGDHKRCLTALRHPKEVLCVELMYLRVITGAADGKLRVWNMVTGQCLRIMRGNSRSDPITSLLAIDNKVTINTPNTLLVLNFEEVEYDYSLEDDKMPPKVQYSSYADAPVRQQPYRYIRAQRMKTAGATDTRIIQRQEAADGSASGIIEQIPHSAKSLSRKSLETAKRIQSAGVKSRADSAFWSTTDPGSRMESRMDGHMSSQEGLRPTTATTMKSVSISTSKPPTRPASKALTLKSRPTSAKTGTHSMFSVAGFQLGRGDKDSDMTEEEEADLRRRVSWAFQNPFPPTAKELELLETKALLRSQIRAKGDAVPPDFIYLAVNNIQGNMKPTEASKNMEQNRRDYELNQNRKLGRPNSSPSRIDPRTKLPIEDLGLDEFRIEQGVAPDLRSEVGSGRTSRMSQAPQITAAAESTPPKSKSYVTNFTVTSVTSKPKSSIHPSNLTSSIPLGRVVRPHTASMVPVQPNHEMAFDDDPTRSKSALGLTRPGTAKTGMSMMSHGSKKRYHGYQTSTTEASFVPMLMYPKDMNQRLKEIKQKRIAKLNEGKQPSGEADTRLGKVSKYNDPLRSHVDFKLRTHNQVAEELAHIATTSEQQKRKKEDEIIKKQRAAWLSKVKKQMKTEKQEAMRPKSGPGRLRTS